MIRGRRELKEMWRDPKMKLLIDSLWREYYALYTEKYKSQTDLDELGAPIDQWIRNKISRDINFAQAIGQGHNMEGNRSAAIGQGGHTTSFMELLLGAYAIDAIDQDAEAWVATDRLIAVGNGTSDTARSNALEIFKSGMIKLFNAITLGDYSHGAVDPLPGTLRFKDSKFEGFITAWFEFLTDALSDNKTYARKNGAWVEIAEPPLVAEYQDFVAGTAKDYVLLLSAIYPFSIDSFWAEVDNGTIDVSMKIGSTAITGIDGVAVDTTASQIDATALNSVAVGNRVIFSLSATYTGTPTLIRIQIKTTRL